MNTFRKIASMAEFPASTMQPIAQNYQNQQMTSSPATPGLGSQLATDSGMNAMFALPSATKKIGLVRSASGAVTGAALGALPASVVNYGVNKYTTNKLNEYTQNDNGVNLGHLAMLTVPSVAAGMFTTGAMMHPLKRAPLLFSKKLSREQKWKTFKHIMNPVKQFKRGIYETKQGFSAFNPKAKMGKMTRFMRGAGLIGVGLSLLPAAEYLYSMHEKKKQQNQFAQNNNQLQNNNQFKNNNQINKTASLEDKVAWVPIFTAARDYMKAQKEVRHLGDLAHNELYKNTRTVKNAINNRNKAAKTLTTELVGTGLLGYGLYKGHQYYKQSNNSNPNTINPNTFY